MASIRDKGDVALSIDGLKTVERFATDHHQVALYRHEVLGRVLVLDGEIQHVERWAPFYHEPLVHLGAALTPRVTTALVLGGGSLFAATELLKYEGLEALVVLEHDRGVVDLVTSHYDHARAALEDPRLDIQYADAFAGVATSDRLYDLVVNDAFDLLDYAELSPFETLASQLAPDGVCADLVYRHIFHGDHVCSTLAHVWRRFRVALSLMAVPEYPGVLHLLLLWGRGKGIDQQAQVCINAEQQQWATDPNSNPCLYFDPRFLPYYLYLPPYLRSILATRETDA